LSKETLLPGSVVTIEPGIYLPGFGGVRIEDMIVVQQRGSRLLTAAPSALNEL
jgi:Xaa-Pro aminopeptidase/Xaa-Pro dipeptidase